VLHGAFALTGVGTVLLGCLLPVLAAHWGVHDARSGSLFAAQFAGSASGGFLTRGRYRVTLAAGLALAAIGAFIIPQVGAVGALPAFFCFGLGLGLTMTASNVLVSTQYKEHRGAALSLLNFSWSAGAVAGPLLVARGLSALHLAGIFRVVGTALALMLVLLGLMVAGDPQPGNETATSVHRVKPQVKLIAFFAVMGFLYVGVENAFGGWVASYANRSLGVSAAQAAGIASIFWLALLAGRGLSSGVLLFVPERVLYPAAIAAATFGIGVTLTWHSVLGMGIGAVVTGLALAPVFPLNLSLYVTRAGEISNAGTMLALTGLGGSVLPWLTGVISGRSGSLQLGLLVPIGATLLMLAMLGTAGLPKSEVVLR
jgi:FHS family glucose/mannose:H+ symporter-like MFS transporter